MRRRRRDLQAARQPRPGKFVWFEHASTDAKKAQAFYAEVRSAGRSIPMGETHYDMITAGDPRYEQHDRRLHRGRGRQPDAHWISYVSVEDVDAAAQTAAASGGKVVEPPLHIPTVGRTAHIADPQGAELYLFKNTRAIRPTRRRRRRRHGRFLWNELHTTDPRRVRSMRRSSASLTRRRTWALAASTTS